MLFKVIVLLCGAALAQCAEVCCDGAATCAASAVDLRDEASLMQVHLQPPRREAANADAGQTPGTPQETVIDPIRVCTNSSNDWRFLCPNPPRPIPPIILEKTHKTGSTTMMGILERLADRRNKRVMPPDPRIANFGHPLSFPGPGRVQAEPPAHQYDFILHHAVFNSTFMRGYVKPSPFLITNLREPGAQALSAFNFFGRPEDEVPIHAAKPTWEEHIAWLATATPGPMAPFYQNSQAYDLGWYEAVGQTTAYDRNETRVQQWLATLDREFDLMILQEYFDEGLVLLCRRLDLDLHEVVSARMNDFPYRFERTEEMYEQARAVNPVDVALYAHFNRTFHEAWEAAYDSDLEADLQMLRGYNQELDAACALRPRDPLRCPVQFTFEYTYEVDTRWSLSCPEIV